MAKIYYYLGHEQFHPEELVGHAKLAEKSGFDGLFVSEHFNPWVADLGAAGYAFATLGAIAATTKTIELMTGVVTPLFRHHPAVVAQAAATIDRLSGGRFYLGVGTGEAINETPLGYDFPDYKERSERMVEALKIMRGLLDKEKLTLEGNFYKTKDVRLYSPPFKPIPIYMAAGGPKSAEIAAQFSDGIIVSVKNPEDELEKIIKPALLKNKNLALIATRWTVFAKNQDEAWKALGPWRGLRAPSRNTAGNPEDLQKEADSLDRKEILGRYTILSSAKEYVDAYSPLVTRLNANIVVIQTTAHKNQKDLIEFLGKDVVPSLKSL